MVERDDGRRNLDGLRPSPGDAGPRGKPPWWADPSRKSRPWWASRAAVPGVVQPAPATHVTERGEDAKYLRGAVNRSVARLGSSPSFIIAVILLVVLMATAHIADTPVLSRILVPVIGLLGTIGYASWLQRRHPDEPWLARLLVWGVIVKLVGTVLRYFTLLKNGSLGDASGFDIYGKRYANAWLGKAGAVAPVLSNLKSSNFMRWFTGIVYYLFGRDIWTGFFVYSLIAFVGSYLWYRAAVVALPALDRKLFFILITFAPSIVFWPAGIGKEALMQFGLGSIALGVAYILNGQVFYGFLVALPGAWLVNTVRAHLLGLATIALAFAYVLGRARKSTIKKSSLIRPIGIILVVLAAAFGVTQGAKRLHINALTPSAVQSELEATSTSTTQGNSKVQTNVSLSPLRLPQDAITVLLRPFPWEVQSKNQIVASLEGAALAAFIFHRRKSVALSLRMLREEPFLLYAWILTLLYVLLFQAFGNFGLLVRERSIVLPALYVLVSLDATLVTRREPALA
jgi:hypothetical protein